jgi:hypothetical protein
MAAACLRHLITGTRIVTRSTKTADPIHGSNSGDVMSDCSSNRILVARWSISNRLIIVTLVLLRSQVVLHLFCSRAAKAVNPHPLLLWKMMPVHLRMPARPISYDESGMVNDGLRMPLPVRLDHHPQQHPCSYPALTSEQREVRFGSGSGTLLVARGQSYSLPRTGPAFGLPSG